jgi:nucleotide-binding universal stress UspA family protein
MESIMTNIVVGTDGTESSHVALRWGLDRAAAEGATLTVAHVLDDEWATVGARIVEELREDARCLLDHEINYVQSLTHSVECIPQLLTGDPMSELISLSSTASVIVVGTHRTGYLHGRVIGSSSLRLAAAADCAVSVIPESIKSNARGITVGADTSPGCRAAVVFAAAEASRLRENLTLVRGWSRPRTINDSAEVRAERDRLIELSVSRVLSDAAAVAADGHPDLEMRRRSIQRNPAEALLEASNSSRLLVVGSTRRAARGRMGLGSVTHDVLLNLAIPTLVVHGDDAQL